MTEQKAFKARVRVRAQKTGEKYAEARRVLLAQADARAAQAPAPEPAATLVGAHALLAATGFPREHWFALLDAWGATTQSHTATARWLVEEHGVAGWWAQTLTVEYQRARGLRAVGQHADGWAVSATRTIAAPAERAHAAFLDEAVREQWLPDARLRLRTATAPARARFDVGDDGSRLVVGIEAKGERCRVAVAHERLPTADEADRRKSFWRERLTALKALLES